MARTIDSASSASEDEDDTPKPVKVIRHSITELARVWPASWLCCVRDRVGLACSLAVLALICRCVIRLSAHCFSSLVQLASAPKKTRCLQVRWATPEEAAAPPGGSDAGGPEGEGACAICMDARVEAAAGGCGHGLCVRCARRRSSAFVCRWLGTLSFCSFTPC